MRSNLLIVSLTCLALNTACVLDLPSTPAPDGVEPSPTATMGPEVTSTPTPPPTPVPLPETAPVYFDSEATIQTIAGSGEAGTEYSGDYWGYPLCSNTGDFGGDLGPATQATLNWPTGVAVDDAGNVLVAEQCNWVIRAISPEGIIRSMPGLAVYAYNGRALYYALQGPGGVEVSARGNRYVVDTWSHVIFKLEAMGLNVAVAGTPYDLGYEGFEGETAPGYPALYTELFYPTGVAEDSMGRLYIANYVGARILMVDEAGIVHELEMNTEFAGGLAIDAADNLYVTDNDNHQLVKRSPEGVVTVLAGLRGEMGFTGDGGPATEARLNWPSGVRVRADGLVFFTDTNNQRVRVIDTDGTLYTVAGNGARLAGSEYGDIGLFGGDGGPASAASLNQPYALDFDKEGNLYIADAMNNRIRKVTFSAKGALRTSLRP
ncbi:MAG: hypothetical protein ACKO6N_07980 [Myxococcota bacterium]